MWDYLFFSLMSTLVLLADSLTTDSSSNITTTNITTTDVPDTNASRAMITAIYGSTTTVQPEAIPEVIITLAVIGGCALVGLGIAKLGDYCYDRRMATRDDISNASEYTKNILRARLAVMKMKSDPPNEDGKTVKAAASAWIGSTVAKSTKEKDKTDAQNNSDFTVEEIQPVEASTDTAHADTYPTADVEQGLNKSSSDIIKFSTPLGSPLTHNKVFPVPVIAEIKDETPMTRANALPPIETTRSPMKSINQPIRSTR